MVRMLMIAVALLAACKKSAAPDCDGAGKAIEQELAKVAKTATDAAEKEMATRMGPALASVVVLRCKEDKWSTAATDCIKGAKADDYAACESKLTKEQAEKFKTSFAGVAGVTGSTGSAADPNAGSAAPAAGTPDCAALEGIMTKAWSDHVSSIKDETARKAAESMRLKARADLGKRCADDGWTAEVTDCFKAATNGNFDACKAKLTPLQAQNAGPMIPPAPPAPPADATGSGSAEAAGSDSAEAAGSGEAGSADAAGSGSGS